MFQNDGTRQNTRRKSKVEITNLPNRFSMKMTINMLNKLRRMDEHSEKFKKNRNYTEKSNRIEG